MMVRKWAFLDMEGVLIPELWVVFAQALSLPQLALTTRDVPDYPQLVRQRLAILTQAQVTLSQLQALVAEVPLLEGAEAFVTDLRQRGHQIVLVSDAFQPLLAPFLKRLAPATLYAHEVSCDSKGLLASVQYQRKLGKHEVVEAILSTMQVTESCETLAMGDAFNDFTMLQAVDQGFLYRPSTAVKAQMPEGVMPVLNYAAILARLSV